MRAPPLERRTRLIAAVLFVALFVVYNANGREIGTVDSQPGKFTAREIAVRGTLTLDRIVAERPALAERAAFARDRQGHFRSAYPLPSALIAAIPATLLHHLRLVDMDAPLAPNLIAALTASVLTAAAVTLIFLAVRRIVSETIAVTTAIAIGVGTNYWAVVSQTLWLHECVAFGLAIALWAWLRPAADIRTGDLWLGGIGLALAGAARPQIAPLVAVMLWWLAARAGMRRTVVPGFVVSVAALASIATKVVGTGAGALLGGFNRVEALRLGVCMISRGEVGLIMASIGLARGIFDDQLFPSLLLAILVSTLVTPPLVRLVFRGSIPEESAAEPAPAAGGS